MTSTAPLESLRDQLRMYADFRRQGRDHVRVKYFGIEDLVLQKGIVDPRSMQPPPVRPIPRACFDQSYRLATRTRAKWVYVEGYALSPDSLGLAVHHAWVTPADNPTVAVDLAWDNPDAVYLGIPFRADFVKRTHQASGSKEYSVLDTWWQHYPLLTGAAAIEDVMWP
jgi:hypothetical protein